MTTNVVHSHEDGLGEDHSVRDYNQEKGSSSVDDELLSRFWRTSSYNERRRRTTTRRYAATFFACFLTFAHLFFAALAIAALPAADKMRFFAPMTSRSAEPLNAFAAARTPLNLSCSFLNCFSSFLFSRLIAARMFMNPPGEIYIRQS